MAIMNPADGPGRRFDPAYAAVVGEVRAAGGRVIGYVHTSYGKRDLAAVKKEVKDYARWYHLDGVFVDEMSSDGGRKHLRYYRQVDAYAHRLMPGGVVVGNPGVNPAEAYTAVADELVLFEDGSGYEAYAPPPWQAALPETRFANIAYGVAGADAMRADVGLAAGRHTGWVYVSDGTLPDPYQELPTYWDDLVGAVAGVNAAAAPR
jgi:hypothetical protein